MNINRVFDNNKKWVKEKLASNSKYFDELGEGQNPELLYAQIVE